MQKIIDGKAFAADLRADITKKAAELKARDAIVPGLAVVLVGEDPASQVYVRNKGKQTVECGMLSFEHKLPDTTAQDELMELIDKLNNDDSVHGILVQLPLPKQIDENSVINRINPDKDVDGFHLDNVGRLSIGDEGIVPCTPLGCLMMIKDQLGDLSGKHAVVVGRSNIVGKPVAALLLQENCTVVITHSRTVNLEEECRRADILVAAVGRPEMVKGDWIKPGATVIDVGINRIDTADGKTRLVGDVDFASAEPVAGKITPVPGGVGPMTIACLLHNTLQQACRINNVAVPE
ncbi:bifunctional methylenetetrahydrofolate dehydrogenase/methenyltetrahydrofolate cyclohydrolase [Chromatiales bacterium (ex Bugula neritina AB1)]|nr:bifunctional methylenetetrahydrofolate dehydrogenase/methenyltetrahydrofolate cyclohydrolase [Chromatiales bacterium (ex Bugula neritina AB1)]